MKKLALIAISLALPLVTFAQVLGNVGTLVDEIGNVVEKVIPILFALALLGFFYGLVVYIFGAEHNKDQAKKTMLWGIIALFVMAAVWGLVAWLGNAVGVDTGTGPGFSPGDLIPQ